MQDIKTFINPTGDWEYNGEFSVELTDDADKSIIPSNDLVNGNVITVIHGYIKQMMNGILFYSREKSFYWSYPKIKVIRDKNRRLLWVNYNYR